ncbi:probable glucan endo-1,3-beta-glucosidase BG4 [Amborella trichopoda]|uniref:probable glucan endo-1,3-beta-glucosidase BG4 n=1 Tax=Amborella trichopoda TaxID=13333 RepID=UPI0009BEBBB3|nr:probable glucan endo-1,3-beta-glucosidase BG4 [Amborella trichopoda]|eukprot:XP_020524301.1 probable glucan endo-1,3-beta-glucosidase BG4 [Amborella trichopoda]
MQDIYVVLRTTSTCRLPCGRETKEILGKPDFNGPYEFPTEIFYDVVTAGPIVGVNWGMLGDNLPSPSDIVKLMQQNNVITVRLFDPNTTALDALRNSEISHCRGEPLSLIPPSQGAFSPEAVAAMNPNTAFVTANDFPRMVNVYPYFGYKSDPEHIPLDHALFRPTSPVVQDGDLSYHNLFDATLDAVYSALEKVGGSTINIVALESGWPSAGYGDKTTVATAQEYNNNLIQHAISTNVALFNEDFKPAGEEQNFALFYPSMEPVYPISFQRLALE